jgi:hypothetical protein
MTDNTSIAFSEREWKYIVQVLKEDLIYHHGLISNESKTMSGIIMDRIKKDMGTE